MNELRTLHDMLTDFQSVSLQIQKADVTFSTVRLLFNCLLQKHADYTEQGILDHLKPDHRLIRFSSFEDAICKVQNGRESDLTQSERIAIRCFTHDPTLDLTGDAQLSEISAFDFAQACIRQREQEISLMSAKSAYIKLSWLVCHTNNNERSFSITRFIQGLNRCSLDPQTVEYILYLRLNRCMFTVLDVDFVVNRGGNVQNAHLLDDEETVGQGWRSDDEGGVLDDSDSDVCDAPEFIAEQSRFEDAEATINTPSSARGMKRNLPIVTGNAASSSLTSKRNSSSDDHSASNSHVVHVAAASAINAGEYGGKNAGTCIIFPQLMLFDDACDNDFKVECRKFLAL